MNRRPVRRPGTIDAGAGPAAELDLTKRRRHSSGRSSADLTAPCLSGPETKARFSGSIQQRERLRKFFDAPELRSSRHWLLRPMAFMRRQSSPDGRIYKVDREGKDTVFFDPEDKERSGPRPSMPRGTCSRVRGQRSDLQDRSGWQGKPVLTRPVLCTPRRWPSTGWATSSIGTESPGARGRIDEQGKGFVVLDSPAR